MNRITEMTRVQFMELYDDIVSGALFERWPENHKARTRAEKVEERRIRVLGALDEGEVSKLVEDDQWTWMEVLKDGDMIRVCAYKVRRM